MARIVRGGLIQTSVTHEGTAPLEAIKKAMIDKHLRLIEEAARKGCQVVCLQELFYGPYFCAEQKAHWYAMTEPIPNGPTTQLMCETAKRFAYRRIKDKENAQPTLTQEDFEKALERIRFTVQPQA